MAVTLGLARPLVAMFVAIGGCGDSSVEVNRKPGPMTGSATRVLRANDAQRAASCPALCGTESPQLTIHACEVVALADSGDFAAPQSDERCPTALPANGSPCSTEGLTCSWPRAGAWCPWFNGKCKLGAWGVAACDLSDAPLVSRPEICPTDVMPIGDVVAMSACPAGNETRCIVRTDSAVCPEVDTVCFNGQWRGKACGKPSNYVGLTCTITVTPPG